MLHLVVPSLKNKEKGFNLIEIAAILVIIGIAGAIGAPSLVNSRRQEQVNQAHSRIRSTLVEAQINANRTSQLCTVNIGATSTTGTPAGCILEVINYPSDVVSVTAGGFTNAPTPIAYDFQGRTGQAQTIWVSRKDFDGSVLQDTGKCIVVSSVGMIRTGIYDTSAPSNCRNIENDRYDSSTP